MEIEICVGSSCHLKGSYQVVRELEEYIALNGLGNVVTLKGSFCLGECTRGVSVKVAQQIYAMDEDNCIEVLNLILQEASHAAD